MICLKQDGNGNSLAFQEGKHVANGEITKSRVHSYL